MITAYFRDNINWGSVEDLENVSILIKTRRQQEVLIYVDYPSQGSEDYYAFTFYAIDDDLPTNKVFPISANVGEFVAPLYVKVNQSCLVPVPLSMAFEEVNVRCSLVGDNTNPGDIKFYVNMSGYMF